ncbi:hypothetical protein [Parvibaculum sp.]|jgi:hypothetical protein|uniref:hypothetical protein n=1 Tax=Parvibaculum sp. TaxID=2024848 RepID=UPI000C46496C|nr:hypothetical protein [Parvibaculum sp.]HAC59854.1 hypothetical protein [Rhodobiaceae bacterium]MAU61543.1 hypothetical protein [Parvibaculum sp.]MBO6668183.1 hypothetical protein [Parvibaculum sp.]MBO6691717.1 hypothetical protein [Parvibaculum sp.]MBO6714699.1 hypothetical protein [Parvibaculum sp.]|tara:strand:- start:9382 stop:10425 length:1044 start_codon:yes stop_codon:yes gene_type:complete
MGEDRRKSWENALADALPVNPFVTGALAAALFFASFLFTAFVFGGRIVVVGDGNVSLSGDAWAALALSLLWFAILGIGRYTVIGNLRDARSLMGIAPHISAEKVESYTSGVTPGELSRSRLAGLLGFVAGGALHAVAVLDVLRKGLAAFANPVDVWMLAMVALLGMQLLRRIYFLRGDTGLFSESLKGLDPDLSDLSRLDVFGRVALRGALPWFTVAGILSLLIVGQDADGITIPALILSLAAAFFVFTRPMLRAHRVIRKAKLRNLAGLRARIVENEKALREGGQVARDAALMLPALIALETRLERLGEWPLDLQTAGRLILYAAIPLGSWFCASIVNIALEALIS